MSDYDRRSPTLKQDDLDQKPVAGDAEMRDRSRSPRSPARSRSRTPPSRSRGRSRSRSVSRSPPPRSRSPAHRSSSRRDDSYDRPSRRRRSPSRSRSRGKRRSYSPRRRSRSPRHRSSRSSSARDKEFHGTREAPEVSNILGVFGLSLRTREVDLEDVFRDFGDIEKVTIVYDHRSNRSRGFGFVYFKDENDATKARDALNGIEIDDRRIRVDYSVTHRPHTPTPGEYMGERRRGGGYDRGDRYRHSRRRERSRTPPRRRYYRSRSRSRSWSR